MSEMKKCPYCGAEVSTDVKKCRYCGEWIVNIHDGESDGNLRTVNYGFDTLLINPIFRDIFNFNGKMGVKEFWLFQFLYSIICNLLLLLIFSNINVTEGSVLWYIIIYILFYVIMILPCFSAEIRRLNDIGISRWCWIICLLTPIGKLLFCSMLTNAGVDNDGNKRKVSVGFKVLIMIIALYKGVFGVLGLSLLYLFGGMNGQIISQLLYY